MNRRKVISSLGIISTHALFPSILFGFMAKSCVSPQADNHSYEPMFFSQQELKVMREIIDVIIPATNSKSATEVGTHEFLDEVFGKCMPAEQQTLIKDGLTKLIPAFIAATDKHAFLTEVDQKAFSGDESYVFFMIIKQYTLVGFFSSMEGMTVASNYVKFPGDYRGEIPLDDQTLNYGKTDLRFYL